MGKATTTRIRLTEMFQLRIPCCRKPTTMVVIRFFILQTHYCSTRFDFSNGALIAAEKGVEAALGPCMKPQKTRSAGKQETARVIRADSPGC